MMQGQFGHRFALMDGQSGIYWGLTLSLCATAPSVGYSLQEVGGSLAVGFLLSGLVTILLGMAGFTSILKKLFNPVVVSVTLFLLAFQLEMNFFSDMIVVDDAGSAKLAATGLSIAVAILVGVLQLKGKSLVSSFALLIGMLVGWVAYELMFAGAVHASGAAIASATASAEQATQGARIVWMPWGEWRMEIGIVVTVVLVGLINMANSLSGVRAGETLYKQRTTNGEYKRTFVIGGLFTSIGSFVGVLPFGVYASSVGFLASTRILQRSALIIGGGLLALLGLFPPIGSFFARLPISIGSAVLFVAYLQMFGTAFHMIQGISFSVKGIIRIALPLLLGISLMNTDPVVFLSLPLYLQPLISNGMVMGVLVSVLLESCVPWSKLERSQVAND